MQTVSFHTLGCKLNSAETSTIGKEFVDRGFSVVEFGEPADVCVINTCSVTARADRECRQIVRRALRTSPNPFVVVTGCYAQLQPDEVASIKGVDLVLGAREKFEIFDYLGGMEKKLYPHIAVSKIDTVESFGPSFTSDGSDRTRAFLKVQDGCDYNCSFCTIPLARGASRSQAVDQCVDQARELARRGFKEITLTGVNVGDYGRKSGTDLLHLLQELVRVDGLHRIRISSIEPNLLTDEIIELVASEERMCRHFHIPLQSGSDEILGGMRRRYTSVQYANLVQKIRRRIPECGIGADVIVGFPGETDDHFAATLEFIEELPVTYLHVFTYSERPNTPAAARNNHIEPKVRFKRNGILRNLGLKKKHAFYTHHIGKEVQVLTEGDVEGELRYGFTDNYIRVAVPATGTLPNELVAVRISAVRNDVCLGEVMDRVETA